MPHANHHWGGPVVYDDGALRLRSVLTKIELGSAPASTPTSGGDPRAFVSDGSTAGTSTSKPGAALSVAQDVARLSGGTGLPVGRTLHKRLAERQYLLSTGHDAESRQTFLVRRAVEGRRSDVLHLRATALTGESGQFGQFVTGTDNGPQPHNGAKPATGSPFDPDVESVSTQPKGGHP